jgi:triphosphoribosyl-dephospho-CoA synthase
MQLLAQQGDSLIMRKRGIKAAVETRLRASLAYEAGGLLSEPGQKAVSELDAFLRSQGNSYNPGSTADIMAAALFVFLLVEEFAACN